MISIQAHQDIAQGLFDAEFERRFIPPPTQTHPGVTIVDSYAIAKKVMELKLAAGLRIKGHKIGLTSAVMREVSGANEPDYGFLFDNWFVPEGGSVSRSSFNTPMVEIELAFVLRDGLSGPNVNAVDVIQATDFVLPAIEIVDSRYTGRGPGPVVIDSIADAAWCGRIVLGGNPRRLDQFDIRTVKGALIKNGEVVAHGVSAAVMGNPVNAVVWLVNKLHEFGTRLEPGQVVMSGSFIKVVPFAAGDEITARYDIFGDVSFSVAA